MTSSDARRSGLTWLPDPLLEARRHPVKFLRVGWNESASSAFGPWRINPAQDPLAATDRAALADIDLLPDMESTADAGREMNEAGSDGQDASGQANPDETQQQIDESTGVGISAEALEAIKTASFNEGLAAGLAQAEATTARDREYEHALIEKISNGLSGLSDDPQRFFDPLRKLALHLAEQLVRSELQISGQAINQLIQHCLDELDHPADKAVVALNPEDLQRLKALGHDSVLGLQYEADANLHSGSVRVSVNDSVVEDLIEHRLEALAHRLLSDPQSWLAQSTLLQDQAKHTPQDVVYRESPSDRMRDIDD